MGAEGQAEDSGEVGFRVQPGASHSVVGRKELESKA